MNKPHSVRTAQEPLVLRIVGMKLRSLPHLTVSGLAQRLEDERHWLDELVGGDREVRAGYPR